MKGAVWKDKIEKGLLWGTKQTFFRRKEIRVSLLFNILQLTCHFSSLVYFFEKLSIGEGRLPFPVFSCKIRKYNFLYFLTPLWNPHRT